MEDEELISLFFARSEDALALTKKKYEKYCFTVANTILHSEEDAEECVNDALFAVWKSIPPERPRAFPAFLSKITRNFALRKIEERRAAKRGAGVSEEVFEELEQFLGGEDEAEELIDRMSLKKALNEFLDAQSEEKRAIFLKRYFYLMPICEIAKDLGSGQSRIKMTLLRQRTELKEYLEKEGITL